MSGKETFDKRTESNVHEQKGVSLMHKTFLLQEQKLFRLIKLFSNFENNSEHSNKDFYQRGKKKTPLRDSRHVQKGDLSFIESKFFFLATLI
jgi:hypothetical protein